MASSAINVNGKSGEVRSFEESGNERGDEALISDYLLYMPNHPTCFLQY